MPDPVRSYFEQLQEKELPFQQTLNNSRLSMYKKCAWLYKLYSMGVRSKMPYIPFSVGTMIHLMLAVFYKKGIHRLKDPRFTQVMDILEDRWNRNLAANIQPEWMKKMNRQFLVIRGIGFGLMAQHIIEEDLDKYTVLQIESQISAPLVFGVRWEGTPDIVVRDKKTKEITHFDHKSASRVDNSYVRSLETGVELEGDRLLIEQLFKEPVTHGFFTILQKHYLYERKNESIEAYAERIVEQYKDTKFHFRYRKDYTPSSNQHYVKQQSRWIRFIENSHLNNSFPMNDESCVGFYDCSFLEFCSKKSNHVFKNYYKIVKPVDRVEKKKKKKKGVTKDGVKPS